MVKAVSDRNTSVCENPTKFRGTDRGHLLEKYRTFRKKDNPPKVNSITNLPHTEHCRYCLNCLVGACHKTCANLPFLTGSIVIGADQLEIEDAKLAEFYKKCGVSGFDNYNTREFERYFPL